MLSKPDQIGLHYCNSRKLLILLHACHSQMKIYGHMVMKDALYEKLYCGELAKSSITYRYCYLTFKSIFFRDLMGKVDTNFTSNFFHIKNRRCSQAVSVLASASFKVGNGLLSSPIVHMKPFHINSMEVLN